MKKLKPVSFWIIRILGAVLVILGIFFAFVELRKLFAGEFLVDTNGPRSFFTALLRGVGYAFYGVSFVVLFLATLKKFREKVKAWAVIFSIASCLIPLISIAFMEIYVCLGVFALTVIPTVLHFLVCRQEAKETPIVNIIK